MHVSEQFLHAEADALDLEAARIELALQKEDSNAVAKMCLEQGASRVGPMLNEEAATVAAVTLEHCGNDPECPAQAEAAARRQVFQDYERLQEDAAAGRDCTADLERIAKDLHAYAALERQRMAPFCAAHMDEDAWREADARLKAYGKPEPQYCDPAILA